MVGRGPKPSAGTESASTAAGGKVWPIAARVLTRARKSRPAGRVTKIANAMPRIVAAPLAASTSPTCDSHSAKKLERSKTGGLTPGKLHSKAGASSGMPNSSPANNTPTHNTGLAIECSGRMSPHQIGEGNDADRIAAAIDDRHPVGVALGHRGERVAQRSLRRQGLARRGLAQPHPLGDLAQPEQFEAAAVAADEIADKIAGRLLDNIERRAPLR